MTAKKTVAKKATKKEEVVLETTNLCPSCEGKGTIMEGHRICPECNGECFK